jgi:hypothetical protein
MSRIPRPVRWIVAVIAALAMIALCFGAGIGLGFAVGWLAS